MYKTPKILTCLLLLVVLVGCHASKAKTSVAQLPTQLKDATHYYLIVNESSNLYGITADHYDEKTRVMDVDVDVVTLAPKESVCWGTGCPDETRQIEERLPRRIQFMSAGQHQLTLLHK